MGEDIILYGNATNDEVAFALCALFKGGETVSIYKILGKSKSAAVKLHGYLYEFTLEKFSEFID